MSLTRIQKGFIANGAVIVPDNLSATGIPSSSSFLRGDGVWSEIFYPIQITNQALFTTSSVTFAAMTVSNYTLPMIDGTTSSAIVTDGTGALSFQPAVLSANVFLDGGSSNSVYNITDFSVDGGMANSTY